MPSAPTGSSRPGRVLFVRATEARDVVATGLRGKGWDVTEVEAYRTVTARAGDVGEDELDAASEADVITFTSPSTVAGYVELTRQRRRPPVVSCIGPVTADAARRAGFVVDIVAADHSVEGLVAELAAYLSARRAGSGGPACVGGSDRRPALRVGSRRGDNARAWGRRCPVSGEADAAPAPDPGAAAVGGRDERERRRPDRPAVRAGGDQRAQSDPLAARAESSTRLRRSWSRPNGWPRSVCPASSSSASRRTKTQSGRARGTRRDRPGGAGRVAGDAGRRHGPDRRSLPRRVHRSRPLRRRSAPTARSTTTPPSSSTNASPWRRPQAGADVVAPSGMMDGQVGGHPRAPWTGRATSTSPCSPMRPSTPRRLYGPFREAVDVTIAGGGDRRGYQQDPRNGREALAEVALDVAEGADMVMVKPAARLPRRHRRSGGTVSRCLWRPTTSAGSTRW